MKIHAKHIDKTPEATEHFVDRVMQGLEIDTSTPFNKEPLISFDNALCDVMDSEEYVNLVKSWLSGEAECCGARDQVNAMVRDLIYKWLSEVE